MHWVYLMLAIVLEVAGTTCMKLSDGFSRPLPSVLVFVFYGSCLGMLTFAFEKLPVSVAYTVWGSVGTVLVVIVARVVFHEHLSALQIASIALVIIGVIGLNAGRSDEDAHGDPERPPTAQESTVET